MERTKVYSRGEFQDSLVELTIKEVAEALSEKGYDPINQIVGYLMSGDPGYISSYKEARNKIVKFNRAKVLEVIVKHYIGK
jgi:uncharacterized protein (UPF0297 family)